MANQKPFVLVAAEADMGTQKREPKPRTNSGEKSAMVNLDPPVSGYDLYIGQHVIIYLIHERSSVQGKLQAVNDDHLVLIDWAWTSTQAQGHKSPMCIPRTGAFTALTATE
jgi:hypothetical protein